MFLLELFLAVFLTHLELGFCHHTFDEVASLARFKRTFEESRIVPDVIPAFDPRGSLITRWNDDRTVLRRPGEKISLEESQVRPVVQLSPSTTGELESRDLFTLIMIDPDSPNQADASGARLHLLGTSLRLRRLRAAVETYILINETKFAVDYLPPSPESGSSTHRYTFLLYRGVASPSSLEPFQTSNPNRTGFNVTAFVDVTGLKTPYAGTFVEVNDLGSKEKFKSAAGAKTNGSTSLRGHHLLWISWLCMMPILWTSYRHFDFMSASSD